MAVHWYNCSFLLGRGLLALGLELENLFRAYTGLASARNVLPEEVTGPHTFK
jgi:hypothetical protein